MGDDEILPFYRIEDPAELFDMGYEEYFFSGEFCFIEWPELLRELLPKEAVSVFLSGDDIRKISF